MKTNLIQDWMTLFYENHPTRSREGTKLKQLFKLKVATVLFTSVPNLNTCAITYLESGCVEISINGSSFMTQNGKKDNYKSWIVETNLKEAEVELVRQYLPFFTDPIAIVPNQKYEVTRDQVLTGVFK